MLQSAPQCDFRSFVFRSVFGVASRAVFGVSFVGPLLASAVSCLPLLPVIYVTPTAVISRMAGRLQCVLLVPDVGGRSKQLPISLQNQHHRRCSRRDVPSGGDVRSEDPLCFCGTIFICHAQTAPASVPRPKMLDVSHQCRVSNLSRAAAALVSGD